MFKYEIKIKKDFFYSTTIKKGLSFAFYMHNIGNICTVQSERIIMISKYLQRKILEPSKSQYCFKMVNIHFMINFILSNENSVEHAALQTIITVIKQPSTTKVYIFYIISLVFEDSRNFTDALTQLSETCY